MARSTNWNNVIDNIFQGSNTYSDITRRGLRSINPTTSITPKKYMEIPVNEDTFELPLLALDAFKNMLTKPNQYDILAARIYSCGLSSSYKSLDAIMKDVLSTRLDKHLTKVTIAGSTNVYYATYGALFNENLKPLMMLSWIIERGWNEHGNRMYYLKRPLLRLDPYPCIAKEDAVQKILTGKFMTKVLEFKVGSPYFFEREQVNINKYSNWGLFNIKVEIDECPFIIRGVDVPSASVTNEALLQLASDHIDEILQ